MVDCILFICSFVSIRSKAMGYRTKNEEVHECDYSGNLVQVGQGVLLKYSETQSDREIIEQRFTNRVGNIPCIVRYGTEIDKEALSV